MATFEKKQYFENDFSFLIPHSPLNRQLCIVVSIAASITTNLHWAGLLLPFMCNFQATIHHSIRLCISIMEKKEKPKIQFSPLNYIQQPWWCSSSLVHWIKPNLFNLVRYFFATIFLLVKVHIFWEGHKILRNLHLTFVLCSVSQK